jgi:hypothetical protein
MVYIACMESLHLTDTGLTNNEVLLMFTMKLTFARFGRNSYDRQSITVITCH